MERSGQLRRLGYWVIGLMAAGLMVLGCGQESSKPGAPKSEKPAAPAAAGPGVKTVVIGFTASKTGKLNVEGVRQINGFNLWLDQVNAAARRYYRPDLLKVVAIGAVPRGERTQIFAPGTFRALFEP